MSEVALTANLWSEGGREHWRCAFCGTDGSALHPNVVSEQIDAHQQMCVKYREWLGPRTHVRTRDTWVLAKCRGGGSLDGHDVWITTDMSFLRSGDGAERYDIEQVPVVVAGAVCGHEFVATLVGQE